MTLQEELEAIRSDRDWCGYLTRANAAAVAERVGRLLEGRSYAFVTVNELFGWNPEVRMGQRLSPESTVSRQAVNLHEDGVVGFFVSDTYGVWGLTTRLEKQPMHTEAGRSPYLQFERDQLRISHWAGAGNRLYWVVAPEPESARLPAAA
jgi:hypothetical protein